MQFFTPRSGDDDDDMLIGSCFESGLGINQRQEVLSFNGPGRRAGVGISVWLEARMCGSEAPNGVANWWVGE